MTVFIGFSEGRRRRADVDPVTYDQTPLAARETGSETRVHYVVDPTTRDGFLEGAYWGLSWSLSVIFGDVLGALIEEATLTNVEEWNGSTWVPVA